MIISFNWPLVSGWLDKVKGLLDLAFEIAQNDRGTDKFKIVGDIALKSNDIELAISCYDKINDLNGLLLIYSSLSLPKQLK